MHTLLRGNSFPNLSELDVRQQESPLLSVNRMSVQTSPFVVYQRGSLYFLESVGEVFFFTFSESQSAFINIWASRLGSNQNHVYGYLSLGYPQSGL